MVQIHPPQPTFRQQPQPLSYKASPSQLPGFGATIRIPAGDSRTPQSSPSRAGTRPSPFWEASVRSRSLRPSALNDSRPKLGRIGHFLALRDSGYKGTPAISKRVLFLASRGRWWKATSRTTTNSWGDSRCRDIRAAEPLPDNRRLFSPPHCERSLRRCLSRLAQKIANSPTISEPLFAAVDPRKQRDH